VEINVDPGRDGAPVEVAGRGVSLRFRAAGDRATRALIYGLRQVEFRGRSDYLLSNRAGLHPAEDQFDESSYQFCCSVGDDVVAACRYSPPLDGAWEAGRLAPLPHFVREAPTPPLQISRVVVRSDLRRALITEVMLCLACRWLLEHTAHSWYFALCLPRLASYYEHFGAEIAAGEDVTLPARNHERYRYVHGLLERSDRVITDYLATSGNGAWTLPARPLAATDLSTTTSPGVR
jgi:hypothetical protein